ncbi:hemerythrin domain-containing protein [Neobacillus sp. OS1-2]|uniref:hemerythrin domain-containing protein n=1 Tax=Neobacillus sp. OS1-2 TaxID=3070680 RepID=UPI0027E1D79E|nr:hemerythrin domain-containing protein [Neobacillus sp. OS1-2]WML39971.1 hemerythrin domain-containing protein [Neobacillus sp. OS1-2]
MQGCPSDSFGNSPAVLSEGLHKLVSEHIPLRNDLQSLHSLCEKVEEEQGGSFTELIQAVHQFFTDLEHHSVREEDILFRMMEEYLGKNGGPISVMEYEHEQANGYIHKFFSNTEKQTEFSSEDMIENAALIKNAYHTLINHFAKEEQVLYPMAERMFTPEEKELVNQRVSEQK